MKIVVLDGYAGNPGDLSWKEMEALGDLVVYDRTAASQTLERMRGADCVLTNKVVISREIIEAAPSVRYIGVMATGVNVVDLDAAHEHGITVTNVPAYSTNSVAQIAFAHILNITNRIGHYTRQVRDGEWSRCKDFSYADTPVIELAGKTLGIVGLGHIGQAVARIAQAFGMAVQAVTSKRQDDLPEGITKVELDTLFKTSDVVTLHCPLTPGNRGMVNRERLLMMKPQAIFVNTARGGLVVDEDLAATLREGRLLGAGIESMEPEPPLISNPLLAAPRCYFTPHIGWASKEARIRLMSVITSNLKAWQAGKPENRV